MLHDPNFKVPVEYYMDKHECDGIKRRYVDYIDVGKIKLKDVSKLIKRAKYQKFYAVGYDYGDLYELEHYCKDCETRICLELCNVKRDGPLSEYMKKWSVKDGKA